MIRACLRALVLCGALCTVLSGTACRMASTAAFDSLELLFGLARPDGTYVSESDWQRFEHEVLLTELDGYTVLRAEGAWLDPAAHVVAREPSRAVIHYFDPARYGDVRQRAERIADAYKQRFDQQSVLIGFGCGTHVFR
jgi:hypothetical protein